MGGSNINVIWQTLFKGASQNLHYYPAPFENEGLTRKPTHASA